MNHTESILERHPLFQDNSRLALLIAQITGTQEESAKRISASQQLLEYIYDVAHIEVRFLAVTVQCNFKIHVSSELKIILYFSKKSGICRMLCNFFCVTFLAT